MSKDIFNSGLGGGVATSLTTTSLQLVLADKEGLRWAQQQVIAHHYLHKPVDVRCRPISYLILLGDERVGCLIFGRPESTRCNGWYGDVHGVAAGKYRLTRWEIINLARVWLDPRLQHGGECYIPNAATFIIAQALRRVVYDYLVCNPPVWPEEPYELRECISYCDTSVHQGTLYRASNFAWVRANDRGIETYARPLRHLTHAEKAHILALSKTDKRAQRLRLARECQQLVMEYGEVGA